MRIFVGFGAVLCALLVIGLGLFALFGLTYALWVLLYIPAVLIDRKIMERWRRDRRSADRVRR